MHFMIVILNGRITKNVENELTYLSKYFITLFLTLFNS